MMQALMTARAISIRRSLIAFQLVASLLLLCAAVAVRLPNFMTVPAISDESREVLWGLDIARGVHFPLTSVDTYDGPLFPYLMALAFRVLGISPELPRLLVLVLNALAVVATYWLGILWSKRMTNRIVFQQLAGLIAASFMLTSSVQIFVNSHLAWSNSTTPFFTTLTVLAFAYALQRVSLRRWLVAGALYGIALQTHPSVIMLAPALSLSVVFDSRGRAALKTGVPFWGVVAALSTYSPVILHNLLSLGSAQASIDTAVRRTYAFGLPENWIEYVARLGMHSIELLRALGSSFETFANTADYLNSPLVFGFLLSLIAALLFLARRGNPFPALAVGSTILLLAVFDRRTNFPYDTRYFGFLLPLIFAAFGILGAFLVRVLWTWTPENLRRVTAPILLAGRVILTAVFLINLARLVIFPLYVLVGVNQFFLLNGLNSVPLLELAQRARVEQARRVWMDNDLTGEAYWMCNGVTAGEALAYLMELNTIPVQFTDVAQLHLSDGAWVALTPAHAGQLAARFGLQWKASTPAPLVHCAPAVIQLYATRD